MEAGRGWRWSASREVDREPGADSLRGWVPIRSTGLEVKYSVLGSRVGKAE